MNPFMGQLPDVPPVKELWKKEKSQYRVWIILFGISILAILGLMVASIVLTQIGDGKSDIVDKLHQYYSQDFKEPFAKNKAIQDFNWNQTVMPSIMVGMISIGAMLFLTTVIKSYQKQNFAFISSWATFSVGMGAMIGFVQLMRQAWVPHLVTPLNTTGGIMMFTAYILFIVIWLMTSTPLVKIRREFQMSMRIEAIKNDPRYQSTMTNGAAGMQQGPFGMGPMGPLGGQAMGTPQQPQTQQQPNQSAESSTQQPQGVQPVQKSKKDKRKQVLENMTVAELKKVASELSISGRNEMKKAELIEAIMRISED